MKTNQSFSNHECTSQKVFTRDEAGGPFTSEGQAKVFKNMQQGFCYMRLRVYKECTETQTSAVTCSFESSSQTQRYA